MDPQPLNNAELQSDYDAELISPDDIVEADVEWLQPMDALPAEEGVVEALTDLVEEVTGLDIDGDGLVNDELALDAGDAFGPSVLDTGNTVVFDSSVNIQVNQDIDLVTMENLEIVDVNQPAGDEVADVETASVEAATEAQARADEAISVGDYEAAQTHRADAEIESEYAGTDSMLHGATSDQLGWADSYQDQARELGQAQSELVREGDYEAAGEASREAANAHREADSLAGGTDHSGQSMLEAEQMDWAQWHQEQSDQSLSDATDYANAGNLDAAENHLEAAGEQAQWADWHGELGMHDGDIASTDPTSEFESNPAESYDGSGYLDNSSTTGGMDTGYDGIGTDTGIDSDFGSLGRLYGLRPRRCQASQNVVKAVLDFWLALQTHEITVRMCMDDSCCNCWRKMRLPAAMPAAGFCCLWPAPCASVVTATQLLPKVWKSGWRITMIFAAPAAVGVLRGKTP